jgi:hypothetical protein
MSFLGAPPPLPGERRGRGRGRGWGRGRGEGGQQQPQQSQYYKAVHGQLWLHAQEAQEAEGRVTEVGGCGGWRKGLARACID